MPNQHAHLQTMTKESANFQIDRYTFIWGLCAQGTVNPLYTDTRYNDKIRYNDNLNVTKPSLKRWRLMKNYAKTLHKIFKQHLL